MGPEGSHFLTALRPTAFTASGLLLLLRLGGPQRLRLPSFEVGASNLTGANDDAARLRERLAVPHHLDAHQVEVGLARLQGGGVEVLHARCSLHEHVIDVQLGVGRQFDDDLGVCRSQHDLTIFIPVLALGPRRHAQRFAGRRAQGFAGGHSPATSIDCGVWGHHAIVSGAWGYHAIVSDARGDHAIIRYDRTGIRRRAETMTVASAIATTKTSAEATIASAPAATAAAAATAAPRMPSRRGAPRRQSSYQNYTVHFFSSPQPRRIE